MTDNVSDQILNNLISDKKLSRDKGIEQLRALLRSLKNLSESGRKQLEDQSCSTQQQQQVDLVKGGLMKRLTLLSSNSESESGDEAESWEFRFGTLTGCSCIITESPAGLLQFDEFAVKLKEVSTLLLTDSEPRVRLAAAESIGVLCNKFGPSVYASVKSVVLASIHENIARQSSRSRTASSCSDGETAVDSTGGDAKEVLHDTAGWRSLETSMKCLQLMVEGCGSDFLPHMDQDVFDLLSLTLDHKNRFVRETGYYLLGALIECGSVKLGSENKILKSRVLVAQWLANGLGDNWSQVRLAGSVATRKMLKLVKLIPESKDILTDVVPPMCLNRYYLAEGVRLYSQESWRILSEMEGGGVSLVSQYIAGVCRYYISQTKADNHAVREAACHAIAELAVKVETDSLVSRVPGLLDALLVCFEDDSWPVRDAACLASARFLRVYSEAGEDRLTKILPHMWSQLEDCIPSVRQGAAESLAILCSSYGTTVTDWVWPRLKEGLQRISDQPADSEDLLSDSSKFSGLSSAPATFGVAMQKRANDPLVHTGQEMYSCGSLAPKMRAGGCSDHSFRRPPTPWETTDGCVQLLAELSSAVPKMGSDVSEMIPGVLEACRKRDFVHHVHFLEMVCKRLPQFARNLGKRYFKPHLQNVFEPVFYSLSCGCELTQVAAEECLRSLAKIFGPSIIRGRIEMLNNFGYLELYDRLVIPSLACP